MRDIARGEDKSTCLYHKYVGNRTHLWDSPVNVPDVRDRNGAVIKPHEYDSKLHHLTPVTVDVVMKWWEITLLAPNASLTLPFSWNIAHSNQNNGGGVRIYQLELKKMQLHPAFRLSFHTVRPADKGKKRAESCSSDDDGVEDLSLLYSDTASDGPSPLKKSRQDGAVDIDMAASS